MAHYAFLDNNNIVVKVITGNDKGETDWESYYSNLKGMTCKRTSYNTRGGIHYAPETNTPSEDQSKSFRKNYAGIGYTYDETRDAFIPPKPYNSWVLNDDDCLWYAPVARPDDGNVYYWHDATQTWVAEP